MLIGISTESSLAAAELEHRLREFVPVTEAATHDECLVIVEVSPARMRKALEILADWAPSWAHGEVELMVGRRRYSLRVCPSGLNWLELDRAETHDLLRDVEIPTRYSLHGEGPATDGPSSTHVGAT